MPLPFCVRGSTQKKKKQKVDITEQKNTSFKHTFSDISENVSDY
jgi:hypothetical protein